MLLENSQNTAQEDTLASQVSSHPTTANGALHIDENFIINSRTQENHDIKSTIFSEEKHELIINSYNGTGSAMKRIAENGGLRVVVLNDTGQKVTFKVKVSMEKVENSKSDISIDWVNNLVNEIVKLDIKKPVDERYLMILKSCILQQFKKRKCPAPTKNFELRNNDTLYTSWNKPSERGVKEYENIEALVDDPKERSLIKRFIS
jgi:hypothetical protein